MKSKQNSQVIHSNKSMTSSDLTKTRGSHTVSSARTATIANKKPETFVSASNKSHFDTFTNRKIRFDIQNKNVLDLKPFNDALQKKAEELEDGLFKKVAEANSGLKTSLKVALEDIDTHKNETREELKETRNSVLGTIALFAAFFTFVSVNVNIFTKAENVMQSIIFMLSFWLCIIGFISLFFLFLNKNKDTIIYKTTEFITTASCILLSAGLMFLLFNKSDSESYKKINDKLIKIQKENDSLKKENSALNEKINKNLNSLDEQIIELRKNQYQLNHQ